MDVSIRTKRSKVLTWLEPIGVRSTSPYTKVSAQSYSPATCAVAVSTALASLVSSSHLWRAYSSVSCCSSRDSILLITWSCSSASWRAMVRSWCCLCARTASGLLAFSSSDMRSLNLQWAQARREDKTLPDLSLPLHLFCQGEILTVQLSSSDIGLCSVHSSESFCGQCPVHWTQLDLVFHSHGARTALAMCGRMFPAGDFRESSKMTTCQISYWPVALSLQLGEEFADDFSDSVMRLDVRCFCLALSVVAFSQHSAHIRWKHWRKFLLGVWAPLNLNRIGLLLVSH